MASCARAIQQAGAASVDKGLWWEPHEELFRDLDNFASSYAARPSSDPYEDDPVCSDAAPSSDSTCLVQRLHAHHRWLCDSLLCFKMPSASSRSAIDVAKVVIGNHTLEIKDDMKNLALELSTKLVLDEAQTYILVCRFVESDEFALTYSKEILVQKIALKYYMERQCVLKCIRTILLFQMVEEADDDMNVQMHEELRRLVKDGIEEKILVVLEQLLSIQHSAHLDPDLAVIWAEESAFELTLVLDIIYLLYEHVISCKANQWKKLLTMFQERIYSGAIAGQLAITPDAEECIQHIKNQAFLILLETLNLAKLLKMVFDEVPLSKGGHAFSLEELREIDLMIGAFDMLEASEYSMLLFSWAIFTCLVSSLPSEKGERTLLEIDHAMYMRLSYENGAYGSLSSMLHGERFQESDALIGGYKSIVKTLLSAFLSAYDIGNQTESSILDEMAEILYAVYHGQECLCAGFWDRENIIDSPVRSLLLALRDMFPYKFIPFVRLLTGLCEGPWAAKCVYEFLCSMIGVTTLYGVSSPSNVGQFVQTTISLQIPNAPGLLIPAETKGHTLQVVNDSLCLVQWECNHNGIILLLVRMMDQVTNSLKSEDVHATLSLISHMLSCNKLLVQLLLDLDVSMGANAAQSDRRMVASLRLDVLEIVSSTIINLLENFGGHQTVVLCIKVLTALSSYCPGRVMRKLSTPSSFYSSNVSNDKINDNFFYENVLKMVIESDHAAHRYILANAVLDFCMVLVKRGVQSDYLNMMVEHLISNVLVNHVSWKYKSSYERWQISAKVFELINVIFSSQPVVPVLHSKILEILVLDTTVHDILVQILSVGRKEMEGLYVNRSVHAKEVEWFEQSLCACLTVMHRVIFDIAMGHSLQYSSMTQLEHAILHHSSGASSTVAAVASYMSFCRNQALQHASVRALSALCLSGERAKPHPISISSYLSDTEQENLRQLLGAIFCKEVLVSNVNMLYLIVDFLIVAAKHEPSLIIFLLDPIEGRDRTSKFGKKPPHRGQLIDIKEENMKYTRKQEAIDGISEILAHSKLLFESRPRVLCCILQFLATLWQRGVEFLHILETFSSCENFWKLLTDCISSKVYNNNAKAGSLTSEQNVKRSFQYLCQAFALEILAFDIFLKQFVLESDVNASQTQLIAQRDALSGNNLRGSQQLLQKWADRQQFEIIVMHFAQSVYDKGAVLQAKAETRALIVGLMVKVSIGNEMGLSASLVKNIKETINIVINHPSFQDLLTYYSTLKCSQGNDLQVLVMNDLYYHLCGELEGCRQIPAGSFEHLASFLYSLDFAAILHHRKKYAEVATPPHDGGFIYDVTSVKFDAGCEWTPLIDCKVLSTIAFESVFHSMEYANSVTFVGESQLSALEAWNKLLMLSICNRRGEPAILFSSNIWNELQVGACIEKLCTALEVAEEQLGPHSGSTDYIQIYMAAQAQLLQVLAWFLFNHVASGIGIDMSSTCMKIVKMALKYLKTILGSIHHVHETLTKRLLGSLLICLESLNFKNQGIGEKRGSNLFEQNMDDTFVDVTLLSMSFLPILCSLVEDKRFASLCVAAINIIIEGFLAPPTWFPILQMHFPTRSTLCKLHAHNLMDFSSQALNLFLSLASTRAGAEMLHSSGIFTHLMSFCSQIRDDLSSLGESGPFCALQKRDQRNEVNWSTCVAVVTSILQSLGDKNGGSSVTENAFLFFGSEKQRMLHALRPPFYIDDYGRKKPGIQKSQTSTLALQETQHVLLLLIQLVNYPVQWSHTLQSLDSQFTEMSVFLLAYIAKEGHIRNLNTNLSSNVYCVPFLKDEITAHQKSSTIGCNNGWFAVIAKGCAIKNVVYPRISSESMSHNEVKHQLAVVNRSSQSSVVTPMLPCTQYTDLVAINIYKIALLLLAFLCKKVQQALTKYNDFGSNDLFRFPELPAPEMLHALQDQVIAVITEVCSSKVGSNLEQESLNLCYLLFDIIEKTLYLDVCIARICGNGPLSIRSEDFLKEYKALFLVVQNNQSLDAPLKSLNRILGLAYPGLL